MCAVNDTSEQVAGRKHVRVLAIVLTIAALALVAGGVILAMYVWPRPQAGGAASAQGASTIMYAPEGATGVIHYDIRRMAADIARAIDENDRQFGQTGSDGFKKLLGKITALDIYYYSDRMGVWIFHGSIEGSDLSIGEMGSFMSRGNGRYQVGNFGPMVIVGSEADDVDDTVNVFGDKHLLTESFISGIGKGGQEIEKALADVDTSSPVWVSMDTPDRSGSKAVRASVYLFGEGTTVIRSAMKDELGAQRAAEEFAQEMADFEDLVTIHAEGRYVIIETRANILREQDKLRPLLTLIDIPFLPATQETDSRGGIAGGHRSGDAASTMPASMPEEWAKLDKEIELDLGNNMTIKLALIPPGKFLMGSPKSERNHVSEESPQHEVTITRPFYIGVHEVTQQQWQAVMATTPWKGKEYGQMGSRQAANYIDWKDASEFCRRLSEKTGRTVTLPTEAQWEYACRAGSRTRFCYGDDDERFSQLGEYAWFEGNVPWDEKHPQTVGRKKPNAWGLYDMHGNVWEWCSDWFEEDYYSAGSTDPTGPATGEFHALRGGACIAYSYGWHCRSAFRAHQGVTRFPESNGFRVVVRVER